MRTAEQIRALKAELQVRLDRALEKEMYERAASLRDKMLELDYELLGGGGVKEVVREEGRSEFGEVGVTPIRSNVVFAGPSNREWIGAFAGGLLKSFTLEDVQELVYALGAHSMWLETKEALRIVESRLGRKPLVQEVERHSSVFAGVNPQNGLAIRHYYWEDRVVLMVEVTKDGRLKLTEVPW